MQKKFSQLRPIARAYVAAVVGVGLAAGVHSIAVLFRNPIPPEWFALAALTLLTGSFTIKVPSIPSRISVSETFVFASVLLFGAAAGTLTVLLETLVISLWVKREARTLYRALFNVAAPAISIWLSATLFFAFSGIQPYSIHSSPLAALFAPLAILTVVYFLLNSWLVAIALGLERQQSPLELWWKNFTWLSVNYFSGASVAALIVTYTSKFDLSTLIIIVPLLVISYLTFRTAMGRVEDSNQHLIELNRLYLSTIETLAMAIDAKDQITHGHIRRVQAYAVGLAKHVGVGDERLIKAIEAAALLHDMGKLAVPEYILNKPGKLTAAEFEKMKLHAAVGADILSAIDFPYPVVPIVRHHHENWDGSGYPDKVRGTDIPIGARILSVVDCFDALTSDRPYRPKLTDEEALAILRERRGSMYDPLVVDAFVRVHKEIAPQQQPSGPSRRTLGEITGSTQLVPTRVETAPLDDITHSADEMLTLYELARTLGGQASLSDAGDVIARHLRRLVSWSLCVFYLYDPTIDEVVAKHAVGDGAPLVRGMRIPLGERLSGWVAANRQTISNSDPVLDLGDAARPHALALRSCISTPLVVGDELVGVLTLYSGEPNAFNEDHKRVIEVVGREIARAFKRATTSGTPPERDQLTGLPNLQQLEQFIDAMGIEGVTKALRLTLLFIDLSGLKKLNDSHGRTVGDEALEHVANQTMASLQPTDILFRYGNDAFVALLHDSAGELSRRTAKSIQQNVLANPLRSKAGVSLEVLVSVSIVTAPDDGRSLANLLSVARRRAAGNSADQDGQTVH
jgi:diguanylate cyclase (GGDEF)-like protein/putative nucleotidyltransferase with HDIG domain